MQTPSLCESCRHVREVRTARSRFLLCELSLTLAQFPKYPRQPVLRCDGYQPATVERAEPSPPAGEASDD